MGSDEDTREQLESFIERLREGQGKPLPKGGLRRIAKTARAALGTGLGMLGGRFKKKGATGLAAVDTDTIELLVTRLGELKGIAMKMGQILGYIDPTLPPELKQLLSLLQTQSQQTPLTTVTGILEEDLGPRGKELARSIDPAPSSVASIGQVHRGSLPDGTPVAIKVRHPGIAEAIRADFKLARIGPVMTRLFVPSGSISVKEFIEEAQARFLEECDYRLEARRQRTFATLYAGHPIIHIPNVHHTWCTERVLVTTWEPGQGLDEFLATGPGPEQRDRLGAALFRFYFGSLYSSGLFHADPHPGNYAFRDDGSMVIYDFGCVRQFEPEFVVTLASLAHRVLEDDEPGILAALMDLGVRIPKKEHHRLHALRLVDGFFSPLKEFGPHPIDPDASLSGGEVMRDKIALMRMRLPGKLLFLFRIRFGLYAVLSRLGAVCDWRALEAELADKAGI